MASFVEQNHEAFRPKQTIPCRLVACLHNKMAVSKTKTKKTIKTHLWILKHEK
ncbi:hypothetical protein F383_29961 [Gossypium arboreum]|uniref:Uncharacterized protein n=1 Tax=Gossypium arboreum TaxID=29729 RepID=A0A0B0N182_GOSAR|nr:hypothetical protein F383_29961 [Gossypium arboreum]